MSDRDLKRLSRRELLEMLLVQSRENDALKQRVEELKAKLRERENELEEAGSLAEAVLRVNDVFAAAEAAAEQYVENVHRMSAQQLALAKLEAQKIRNEAGQHGARPAGS